MTAASSEDEAEELRELATLVAAVGCVWWILAGAIFVYWANGGTAGVWILWGGSGELAGSREPWLVSLW